MYSAFQRSVRKTHCKAVSLCKTAGVSQWTLCLGMLLNHLSSEDHCPSTCS